MVIKVERDDHGHATLLVHGEPDIIEGLATAITLLFAADADQILFPEDLEELLDEGGEEDIASSS